MSSFQVPLVSYILQRTLVNWLARRGEQGRSLTSGLNRQAGGILLDFIPQNRQGQSFGCFQQLHNAIKGGTFIMAAKKKKPEPMAKSGVPVQPVIEQPKILGMVTGGEYLAPEGIPRTRSKVAIVGFAPSSMEDAKVYFDDPDWEIWGLNQLYIQWPMIGEKATRWFQIHHRREYDIALRDHNHHDWLAKNNKMPIYMQNKEPDIPTSVPFPKNEMIDMFGTYFTNSISWEIALAIYEGFETIAIFGVDMATDAEYREQRPSCEYFVGWGRALGITMYVPPQSDLCKSIWLYPFEDSAPFRQKIDGRRKELRARVDQISFQEQQAHDQRLQILGALENMNYIEMTWCWNNKENSRECTIPEEKK
jgi:hypothetical protein